MSEIPRYSEWTPEGISRDYTIDFRVMRSETRDPWCVCIVSKFRDPKNRLEQDKAAALVPILTINAYGISPQAAQYEAFKQASYFLHYGVLPEPEELRLPGNLYEPTVYPPEYGATADEELPHWERVRIIPEEEMQEGPI